MNFLVKLLISFMATVPCPVTGPRWKDSGTLVLALPFEIFISINEIPSQSCPFQTEQLQLPQPLLRDARQHRQYPSAPGPRLCTQRATIPSAANTKVGRYGTSASAAPAPLPGGRGGAPQPFACGRGPAPPPAARGGRTQGQAAAAAGGGRAGNGCARPPRLLRWQKGGGGGSRCGSGCRAQAGAEQQRRPQSPPAATAAPGPPAPPPRSAPPPAPARAAAPPGDDDAGPGLGGTRHLRAHPLRRALAHALHVHHLHVSAGVRGDGAGVVPSPTRHRARSARGAGPVRRAASAPGWWLPCPGCQPGTRLPACGMAPADLAERPGRGSGRPCLGHSCVPALGLWVETVLWFPASCSVRWSLLRSSQCCWGRLSVCRVLVYSWKVWLSRW